MSAIDTDALTGCNGDFSMRLIQAHPIAPQRDGKGHVCVGLIDLELTSDVRLYKLRLLRMRDGRHRIYAPMAGRNLAASFSPELAEKITAIAVDALGELPHAA